MTGLGDRRHLLRPGINLDTHTDDVVNLIEMEDLNDIVLVGWSYGGMVVGNVLGSVPQRIASMVYLDAFVPDRGRSLVSYANRSGTPDGLIQQAMEGKDLALFPLDRMGITDKAVIDYYAASGHPIATFLQVSRRRPSGRSRTPHLAAPAWRTSDYPQQFVDEKGATRWC
jgi:pimeloyl-ACP methyl ester carboxylesterase